MRAALRHDDGNLRLIGRITVRSNPGTATAEQNGVLYEQFFGLAARPFLTLPDPDFLYLSEGHQLALSMLRYGILTRAPVTVMTGAAGTGKTTLIRQILNELPAEQSVGIISNMQEGRGDLLHWVLEALDVPYDPAAGHVALVRKFQDLVVGSYGAGRRVLLIFDEAHNLGLRDLEELRMLLNINVGKDELLQIVLVGQPALREIMAKPQVVQIAQRVSADADLPPLRQRETAEYIRRRLRVAGAEREIFAAEAMQQVHRATSGVPRMINVLCDMAMVHAFADDSRMIDERLLQEFLNSARRRGVFRQFVSEDPAPRLVPAMAEA